MRIRLESVGCRLNIGEMEAVGRRLATSGHQIVSRDEPADMCVFNSCTVTAEASRSSRKAIRRLRRNHPDASLVATGCYAEMSPEEVRSLGADLVVGNADKDRLPEALVEAGLLADASPALHRQMLHLGLTGAGRTRAFLKVQDGCDNRCAFCIVTVARGPGRSMPADEVIAEASSLVAAGYRELVLTGVHLGSYGIDHGRPSPRGLADLVRRLLAETSVERLRLSSLEPWDLDAGFFELFADPRLLPHLHLPLQSGCDATLRRMARRCTTRELADLVGAARRSIPDLSVSTDVMVGFPGETDAEHAASLAFVEERAFSRLHVFRYSPRDGTKAARMAPGVSREIAAERSREMLALGARLERDFAARFLGRRLPVLWEDAEERVDGRRWRGLTPNYLTVHAVADPGLDLANRIQPAVLDGILDGALTARLAA